MTPDEVLKLADVKTSAEVVDRVREWNTELEVLGKELDDLKSLTAIKEQVAKRRDEPVNPPPVPDGSGGRAAAVMKSLGELITDSAPFKQFKETKSPSGDIVQGYDIDRLKAHGLKTLFQTTAGWAPESIRIPGLVIDAVTRPIQLLDIIPTGVTGQASVVYMEETTRTHSSAERAENAAALLLEEA